MSQVRGQETHIRDKWPELVGKSGEEARMILLTDTTVSRVMILGPGEFADNRFPSDSCRVKVYVDDKGIVKEPGPVRG